MTRLVHTRRAMRLKLPGTASVRRCPKCDRDRPTRVFCDSHEWCWPCRKPERTRQREAPVAPAALTPTERERRRVQSELELARAITSATRALAGLPVFHGCVPIERDAPLSQRGMHVQLVVP